MWTMIPMMMSKRVSIVMRTKIEMSLKTKEMILKESKWTKLELKRKTKSLN